MAWLTLRMDDNEKAAIRAAARAAKCENVSRFVLDVLLGRAATAKIPRKLKKAARVPRIRRGHNLFK